MTNSPIKKYQISQKVLEKRLGFKGYDNLLAFVTGEANCNEHVLSVVSDAEQYINDLEDELQAVKNLLVQVGFKQAEI